MYMIQQIITTFFNYYLFLSIFNFLNRGRQFCFYQSPICLYIIKNFNLKIYSAIYNCIKIKSKVSDVVFFAQTFTSQLRLIMSVIFFF